MLYQRADTLWSAAEESRVIEPVAETPPQLHCREEKQKAAAAAKVVDDNGEKEAKPKEREEDRSLFASASRTFEQLFGGYGGVEEEEAEEEVDLESLSVRELRKVIVEGGLCHSDCIERSDLVNRAHEALHPPPPVGDLDVGGYQCCVVGDGTPDLVIVMFHGYMAPASELVPLAGALAKKTSEMGCRTRFILPQSPGNSWFNLNISSYILAVVQGEAEKARVVRQTPAGVSEMRIRLRTFLGSLRDYFGFQDNSRICLAGFSQGAMVALDAALDAEESVAGVVLISGFVMSVETWAKRLAHPHRGIKVLQLHGVQDSIIPFYTASWLRDLLKANGATSMFIPHSGGHEFGPPHVFSSILSFLASL